MRAVVTRVKSASVTIGGEVVGSIPQGFLILLGVTHEDTEAQAVKLADKLMGLRIFEDENGKKKPVLNKKETAVALAKQEAIKAASDYLGTAVYRLFRHLYRAGGNNNEDFFAVPVRHFVGGLPNADMICSEAEYVDALAAHVKEKGSFPTMNNDALMENYPGLYQSLLQIIHNTGERINHRMNARRADAR